MHAPMAHHDDDEIPKTAPLQGKATSRTPEVPEFPAPRTARAVLRAALACCLGVTAAELLTAGLPAGAVAVSLPCLLAAFALQMWHAEPAARYAPARRKALTLGAQALLTYLPVVVCQAQWTAMAGFLAGSLLLMLPARRAWPLYTAVGLSMSAAAVWTGLPPQEAARLGWSTLLAGVIVYALVRLAALVRAAYEARNGLAVTAVANERQRYSRDLHDLLGYSLSSITLKSELARRLIASQPRRAMDEVGEVLTIARQSLADVRAVSSGLRSTSLRQEAGSAQSLLEAADVTVRAEFTLDGLDARTDGVLGAVLREAVTNLLRHSRATSCSMGLLWEDGQVRLYVENDGVDPGHRDASPHGGSGLRNLDARLRAAGGRLTVVRPKLCTFRLEASAPLSADGAAARPGSADESDGGGTLPVRAPAA
ncbi:hypothetical protein SCA03_63330 [Streptomyces cacaoi]|uniref:Signal transduction histidine kinase subgroup 3 dimerisation and phosphoacceptor domain-containing protein n=2 Tax=Streptomyces cacaoi TaxID=1898 RepID=A0A4Y3R825_STRCI|nr:hypothetical protein SCA03_63330 [Streptomyces cacaoi]